VKRIKTGVPGLDVMLNGGLPEGRSILVTGPCGTGKTLIGYHFMQEGHRERQKCVLITFEQTKDKVVSDAKEIGIDLKTMETKGDLRIIGGNFGTLRHFKERAHAKTEDLIQEIADVIKDTGAKRVVIDSVNLFTMLFDDDSDRRIILASLIYTLDEMGCTSLLTCEVPEDSGRFGWFGFEEFMVDGVVSLRRLPFDGNMERSITIIKMRGSAHNMSTRAMIINDKGVVVYPDEEPASVRLAHHSPD